MALSKETKAGAFFLIAFVMLGLVTFKVEEVGQLFRPTYILKARFSHASGLKKGDPVAVAGVTVGAVKELLLDEDGVTVVAEVRGGVQVRKNAIAAIAWQGLLGTKYLDISLGTRDQELLESGSQITNAREPVQIGEVMARIDEAATEARKALSGNLKDELSKLITNVARISEEVVNQQGTLGKLVGSDEMYKKLDSIATDLSASGSTLKRILADNEKDLDALIKNLASASPEVKTAFERLQSVLARIESGEGTLAGLINDPDMYKDVKTAVQDVRDFAEKLKTGKGLAQRLASDEQMAQDAAGAVAEFRKAADGVSRAVADVQAFVRETREGKGTIQLLLTDRALYDDARKLMTEARDTLRSVKEQVPVGTFTGLLTSAF